LRLSYDTNLDSVDQAEQRVLEIAQEAGFDEDQRHEIGIAVREAMVNAVVHGNKYSAGKKATLTIENADQALTLLVEDEGEGLDVNALPDPLAEENLLRPSGRGLLIIQAFVDEFAVEKRQPSGTTLRMVKRLAPASFDSCK
jgi:serine/threonine-protein kinase RsbW